MVRPNTRSQFENMMREAVKWKVFVREYNWGMLALLPPNNDDFNHRTIRRLSLEELELGMEMMKRFNPAVMFLSDKLNAYVQGYNDGGIEHLPQLWLEALPYDEVVNKELDGMSV